MKGHLMDELPFALDRTSHRPLADQLAVQLRDAAAGGHLRVGERLPSTRALARSLAVSRTVTSAAYDQLYAEGWIAGLRGSGTYVAAVPPGLRHHQLSSHLEEDGEQSAVDLRPGSPWVAGIRMDTWRRAWRVASDAGPDPRPLPAGTSRFRAVVAEHMLRHRGVLVEPASVLATGGTTAALGEVARAVLRPGDQVAVEEPGYQRAVETLRTAGVIVRRAPVDRDGLMIDRIPAEVRAVYCTPAHQFPLGGRLPAARRVALVEWARSRRAWVIEDDYDGELRYDVAPLPVLAALDPDVVIYLGTASKILSPTLGVGWLVGPSTVTGAVVGLRTRTSTRPSVAGQRVMTAFAESGDLARHFRRVRRELAARRALVVHTLTAAGLRVRGDQAGAHVVVPLANLAVERAVIQAVQDAGLAVDGLERCFDGRSSMFGLTLGYAAPAERRQLCDALDALAGLLRAARP
jgi:GntR family transcriptional regulator/MocR family aminotransferase